MDIITFIWLLDEEFVKEFMLQWMFLCGCVRQDVLVCNIVQAWDGIETATAVMVAEECDSFSLCSLNQQRLIT